MDNVRKSQSFTVDDIRRIRNEDDKRRQKMTREELWDDIRNGSEEVHHIMEKVRNDKAERRVI